MSDAMPTIEDVIHPDILQPKPQPQRGKLPDIEDVILPQSTRDAPSLAGEQFDQYFGDQVTQAGATTPGKILNQFAQGFKQSWGDEPLGRWARESPLRKDLYQGPIADIVRDFHNTIIRPLAIAVDLFGRVPYSVSRGLAETASPLALLGAAGSVVQEAPIGVIPHMPAPNLPNILERAHDLGVTDERRPGIVPNETERAPSTPRPVEPTDRPIADTLPTPEVSAPDIHELARQESPVAMGRYDALGEQQQALTEQLDRQAQMRAQDPRAAAAQNEINTILGKVNGVEARLTKNQATRLSEIRDDLKTFLSTDTEEMSATRLARQKLEEQRMDLAPEVTKAYQAARAKMPPEEAPKSVLESEPLAEPAPEPPTEAEAVPIAGETPEQTAARILNLTQRQASIAQTVAAQLREAGRPVEEANAAGRLQQFHYESRAARFDGALGTGRELFDKEAPTVASVDVIPTRGKTPVAGRLEITDNIIRLATSHADASTFIHELGHSWLEEMLRDAQHPQAPTELKEDMQTIRDFLKMKEDLPSRTQHETFADGFVSYVMQGTAPTEGLARVFSKFKQWLTSVYQTIMRSPVKLNDSIQGVYDRLLSHPRTETIIAPERDIGRDFADVHEADAAGATPENAIEKANQIRGERDEAAQLLTPEINNARRRTREESGPAAGRGTGEAGAEGDAVLPTDTTGRGPGPGAEEAGGKPVAISPSGAKFKAKNESPTGGAEPFGEGPTRLVDANGRPVLDTIESPDDIDSAVRLAAQRSGNRGEATPGQLIDLSEATGIDASLIGRTLGRVFDSGEMKALTDLAIDAATDVKNKMVQAAEGGDALELALALARLDMIQAKALQEGAHAWGKAGNALRAFKEATGGRAIEALDKLLKEQTGRSYDQLMQLARMNGALNTPQQVGAAVHQFHNKFTRGVVFTVVNGFLSNPYTHMVYAAGNSLRNTLLVPQAGIAGVIGEVRTGIREALGLTPEDQVYMREAGAALHGITEGFKNALVPALESFKAGQQMPLPGQKGFSSPWGGAYASPFPDAVNNVIGFPGKSVAGIHQFGRVIFYEQHLQRLATRQAIDEGLQGNALSARIARLTSNPSVDMMREAADAADNDMFQRHGNFNSLTRAIEGWTDKYALAKLMFPFVKIGMEITRKQFVEYSPLGMFSHEVRGDLMMRHGGAAFDEAAAKQMIGLGMLGAGVSWAMSGNITGPGPSDPKARSAWLLEHRPYSFKVGNLWIPYKGLGPQANLLEFAVDLVETQQHWDGKDGEKLATGYMKAVAHSALSESFFRSTAALTNVFADPGRNAPGFLENLAGAAVPFSSLVGSTNRMFFDPYQKDIEPGFKGFVDGLRAKIPVASWDVPNRVDAFGNDVPSRGTVLWPQGLTSRYANDPTAQWLDSLGTGPGRVDRTIGNVRLTEDQFIDLSRLSGQLGKEFLDDARPILQGYPRGQQLKEIDHLLNHARHLARVETKLKSMGTSNDIVEQEMKLKEKALE